MELQNVLGEGSVTFHLSTFSTFDVLIDDVCIPARFGDVLLLREGASLDVDLNSYKKSLLPFHSSSFLILNLTFRSTLKPKPNNQTNLISKWIPSRYAFPLSISIRISKLFEEYHR
jgi:hypothetical protein